MENTADHLIVIGRGRLIADCTVEEFIERNSEIAIRVRTPDSDRLRELVTADGGRVTTGADQLLVTGLSADRIGDLAFDNAVRLHELAPVQASLEEAFMELTRDSVEFHTTVPAQPQSTEA
jgi:ABC-2 type transport system ATP-binding protein